MIYDITDRDSFNSVHTWMNEATATVRVAARAELRAGIRESAARARCTTAAFHSIVAARGASRCAARLTQRGRSERLDAAARPPQLLTAFDHGHARHSFVRSHRLGGRGS